MLARDRQRVGRPSDTATPQPPRLAFEYAPAHGESGEALEGLVSFCTSNATRQRPVDHYEHAYAAPGKDGQTVAAARSARVLAWICGNALGDWAVQSGWLARARTLRLDVRLPNDIALLSEYDLDNYAA